MMIGRKKQVLSQILGPEDSEKEEGGGDSALHSISQELIEAVKADDPAGVAAALSAAFQECGSENYKEG